MGTVKANAPIGRAGVGRGHAQTSKTSQSIPVFQLIARSDPNGGYAVCPVPAELT